MTTANLRLRHDPADDNIPGSDSNIFR